jgi:hypothetical protein
LGDNSAAGKVGCPFTDAPHFSQNFPTAENGVPQSVQKRDTSVVDCSGARMPHAVQNNWPSARSDPHFVQAMLMLSP